MKTGAAIGGIRPQVKESPEGRRQGMDSSSSLQRSTAQLMAGFQPSEPNVKNGPKNCERTHF